jgi:hypothetical protein
MARRQLPAFQGRNCIEEAYVEAGVVSHPRAAQELQHSGILLVAGRIGDHLLIDALISVIMAGWNDGFTSVWKVANLAQALYANGTDLGDLARCPSWGPVVSGRAPRRGLRAGRVRGLPVAQADLGLGLRRHPRGPSTSPGGRRAPDACVEAPSGRFSPTEAASSATRRRGRVTERGRALGRRIREQQAALWASRGAPRTLEGIVDLSATATKS